MTPVLSPGAERRPPTRLRWLERLIIVLVSLAIAVGIIAVLSGGLLAGSDTPGLYGANGLLGVGFRDQGDLALKPGAKRPVYDSVPPTSGPHIPTTIRRDAIQLSDDQVLTALAAGNVVLMYGTPKPPAALRALSDSIAAPFSPALAAAGQAIVLDRRPEVPGVIALAWTRLLHVRSPTDPQLRSFVLYWLGQGAARH